MTYQNGDNGTTATQGAGIKLMHVKRVADSFSIF